MAGRKIFRPASVSAFQATRHTPTSSPSTNISKFKNSKLKDCQDLDVWCCELMNKILDHNFFFYFPKVRSKDDFLWWYENKLRISIRPLLAELEAKNIGDIMKKNNQDRCDKNMEIKNHFSWWWSTGLPASFRLFGLFGLYGISASGRRPKFFRSLAERLAEMIFIIYLALSPDSLCNYLSPDSLVTAVLINK